MAASALKPSAGRHRGERACLSCLGRVGQDCSFYRDCQQHTQLITAQKHLRLLVTLWLSRSRGLVGTAAARWPSLSIARVRSTTCSNPPARDSAIHTHSNTTTITIDSLVLSFCLLKSHRPSAYHVQRPERSGSRIADHLAQQLAYHFWPCYHPSSCAALQTKTALRAVRMRLSVSANYQALFSSVYEGQANVPCTNVPPIPLTKSWKLLLQVWFPAGSEPICVSATTFPYPGLYSSPLTQRRLLYIFCHQLPKMAK